MALAIKRAAKKALKLRLSLTSPSGGGRTYTSLSIAFGLLGIDVSNPEVMAQVDRAARARVLVVDTDFEAAEKYAGTFPPYDVINLDDFAPENYVESITLAETKGYDVLVLDGLSPAWMGKGGILDSVDKATVRCSSSNTAWKIVTPRYEALYRRIQDAKVHVIGTFRAKVTTAVERDAMGKAKVTRLGMTAIAREGSEFEFDIAGDLVEGNRLIVQKSRCSRIANEVIDKPGFALARIIAEWLESEHMVCATPEPVSEAPLGTQAAGSSSGPLAEVISVERTLLLNQVAAIVDGRDLAANTLFREPKAKCAPWITAVQTWRDLTNEQLSWAIANSAKFAENLAEFSKGHAQSLAA